MDIIARSKVKVKMKAPRWQRDWRGDIQKSTRVGGGDGMQRGDLSWGYNVDNGAEATC